MDCLKQAQKDSIVLTKNGKPVALILGAEGMDMEQVELSLSDRFWRFIEARRRERKTITHQELLRQLDADKNAKHRGRKTKTP